MMSASSAAGADGEVPMSSTAEAAAKLAASGLKSCARCLSMSQPDAEGCTFCGQRFSAAFKREAATIALRAIVIPLVLAAVGLCIWIVVQGQTPAALLGPR
jgi:hypothetical protein